MTQNILLGGGLLAGGAFLLTRYKGMARRAAKGAKDNPLFGWTRFDYSEGYFRGLYGFAGVFMILTGLISLVGALKAGAGAACAVCDYVVWALVAAIFGGGIVFIFYSNWRFGNRKK